MVQDIDNLSLNFIRLFAELQSFELVQLLWSRASQRWSIFCLSYYYRVSEMFQTKLFSYQAHYPPGGTFPLGTPGVKEQ